MTGGAEASDHFGAWMTVLGAGIALVSGLTVAALSAFFESRRDDARRAHENHVEQSKRQHESAIRFHDERLNAYVEYMSAVSALFATASVWLNDGANGSFSDYAGQQNTLSAYPKAMTRVTMLAKPELIIKVSEVHSYVMQLVANLAPDAMRQTVEESVKARAAFETAAKKELGIS